MTDDAILRLLDGLPPLTPEEAAARAPYERLVARIRALPDVEPPAGYEWRAVQRWRERAGAAPTAYAIVRGWEDPPDAELEAVPSRLWLRELREVNAVAVAIDNGTGATADEIRAAIVLVVLDQAFRAAAERCVEMLVLQREHEQR